jgi:hypothetical protein
VGSFETGKRLVKTQRNLILEVSGQPRVPKSLLGAVSLARFYFRYPGEEVLGEPASTIEYLSLRGANLMLFILRL